MNSPVSIVEAPPSGADPRATAPVSVFRAPRPEIVNPDRDMVLKVGFGLLLIDTFLVSSRSLEILSDNFGIALPFVFSAIHYCALICALLGGRIRTILATPAGLWMAGFTGWMLLGSVTSFWKGGSADIVLHSWMPTISGFLACGLIVTLRQARRIGVALGASAVVVALASLLLGTQKDSRLSLVAGTLGNPNDLSMLLLFSAPFLLVPLLANSKAVVRAFAVVCGLLVLITAGRAGSRSGLIALVAMSLLLFWLLPIIGKVKMAIVASVLCAAFVAVVPSYILVRYATIFSDPAQVSDLQSEAYGSKIIRQKLFFESVQMTLDHPIVGVGPGAFLAMQADIAKKEGRPSEWRVSHNAYTQVSAETGVPGLILYLGGLLSAVSNLLWMRKQRWRDETGMVGALSLALLISLVGLCANLAFSSNAYMFCLPLLVGLSVAFRAAAEREFLVQAAQSDFAHAVVKPLPWSSPMRTSGVAEKAPDPKAKPAAPALPEYPHRFLGRPRRAPRPR